MAISMYRASAPRFASTLTKPSLILDKAQAYAEARKNPDTTTLVH